MVDIISRRDGPRRDDARAKQLIEQNRGAITQLADRLTQGGYSASKAAKAAAAQPPRPEGRMIHDLAAGAAGVADTEDLRIKVSLNGRVVAYDSGSGRQRHLLGEIRRLDGTRYFALATAENGFISGLSADVLAPIEELDGQIIDAACPETLLAAELAERLGYS
jgi:hypothetical protein